ncbi:MAG TPA: hypothetical protein VKA89_01375 [Solirubrobacterales bacterium]|nr:hypothetical protein [Solirubrobacterales bacterium]
MTRGLYPRLESDLCSVVTELVQVAFMNDPERPIFLSLRRHHTTVSGTVETYSEELAGGEQARLTRRILDALCAEWEFVSDRGRTHVWFWLAPRG